MKKIIILFMALNIWHNCTYTTPKRSHAFILNTKEKILLSSIGVLVATPIAYLIYNWHKTKPAQNIIKECQKSYKETKRYISKSANFQSLKTELPNKIKNLQIKRNAVLDLAQEKTTEQYSKQEKIELLQLILNCDLLIEELTMMEQF